jgi:pimeloyl-ACP methyl ester carboxylesterase
MFDKLIHKWLKVPYTLHVRSIQRPKKPRATILFIHGIGSNGDAWKEVITQLPNDIRIITIDLLGFGDSPQPEWAVYDARTQASSVLATYFKLRIRGKITIVGHSLGSLVAVEMAKRYPLLVRSLILCSPPFYKIDDGRSLVPQADKTLRRLYTSISNNPDQFVKLTAFAIKYKLIDRSYSVTLDNVDSYMAALNAMIINQTSLEDVQTLRMPIKIIRGSLDPFVVAKNLRRIAQNRQNVHLQTIVAGHEVKGFFIPAVVKSIEQYGAIRSRKLRGKIRKK